jgi:DNA-binding Xre family transcriptional regulator
MKTDYQNLVLQKLTQFRHQKKWCQEMMADRLGTCQSNYSSMESGKHNITLSQFIAICKVLEKHPSDFFTE